MSGLGTRRVWIGSAALVAAFAMVACGDDDPGDGDVMAGKSGGGAGGGGGKSGSPGLAGDGGTPAAGTSTGGKAGNNNGGKSGNPPTEGGTGGDDPGAVGGAGGMDGGGGEAGEDSLSERVRNAFAGMSPLPATPPADPTNAFAENAAAATLGQRLFFDEKFSGKITAASDLGAIDEVQKVSCASCHSGLALDDERSDPSNVSKGTGVHTRNSPAVVNSAYYEWTNWGGRFSAQWELPIAVVESGVIMNGNRLAVAHRIYDAYKDDYNAIFDDLPAGLAATDQGFPAAGKPKANAAAADGVWELNVSDADRTVVNRILANYAKALQAYMRKLTSHEAPFDLFMAGDDAAMSESAQRGAMVFSNKGCMDCHSGSFFSDQKFHDLGVPQTGPGVPASDDGRFKDMPGLLTSIFNRNGAFSDKTDTGKLDGLTNPANVSMTGQFRTPSLRNVARTAPYMHSGQFATLSDVIDFYELAPNGDTAANELDEINVTLAEKADLISFLETLNGAAVTPALVVDTAAP